MLKLGLTFSIRLADLCYHFLIPVQLERELEYYNSSSLDVFIVRSSWELNLTVAVRQPCVFVYVSVCRCYQQAGMWGCRHLSARSHRVKETVDRCYVGIWLIVCSSWSDCQRMTRRCNTFSYPSLLCPFPAPHLPYFLFPSLSSASAYPWFQIPEKGSGINSFAVKMWPTVLPKLECGSLSDEARRWSALPKK